METSLGRRRGKERSLLKVGFPGEAWSPGSARGLREVLPGTLLGLTGQYRHFGLGGLAPGKVGGGGWVGWKHRLYSWIHDI